MQSVAIFDQKNSKFVEMLCIRSFLFDIAFLNKKNKYLLTHTYAILY